MRMVESVTWKCMGSKEWSERSQMNGVNEPIVIVPFNFHEESA
jgi:hypothetical protein